MEKLKIEKLDSDRSFNYWEVSGMTPEEIAYIETGTDREDIRERLCMVMENHGNTVQNSWACGYGIYSVNRKLDPNCLIVKTGNSCD